MIGRQQGPMQISCASKLNKTEILSTFSKPSYTPELHRPDIISNSGNVCTCVVYLLYIFVFMPPTQVVKIQSYDTVRSGLVHLQPSPTCNWIAISVAASPVQNQQTQTPVPSSAASSRAYPRYHSLHNTYIPGGSFRMTVVSNRSRAVCLSYLSFPSEQ